MGDKIDSVRTDDFGNYTFLDVPVGGDYEVIPFNDSDIINGVNTLDLVFLIRHLLEISPLNSPYRKLASDINESKSISTLDVIAMRRAILVIDTTFARTESWKFVDANFDFSLVSNPIQANYQEQFEIIDLQENLESLDFIAIKMGDLNDNGSAQSLVEVGDTRDEPSEVNLMVKDQKLEKGTMVEIPVYAQDWGSVLGLQFTAEVNTSVTLLEVGISDFGAGIGWTIDNFGIDLLENGILKGSWVNEQNEEIPDNAELFSLKVMVNKTTTVKDLIKLTDDQLKTESYTGSWNENIETGSVNLLVDEIMLIETITSELLNVYPNPVLDFVNIEFLLAMETEINWEVYDVFGQIVGQGGDYMQAGKGKLVLPRRALGATAGPRYLKITMKATNEVINANIILLE